MNEIIN